MYPHNIQQINIILRSGITSTCRVSCFINIYYSFQLTFYPYQRLIQEHSLSRKKIVKYQNPHNQLLKTIPEADVWKQTFFIKVTVGRSLGLFLWPSRKLKSLSMILIITSRGSFIVPRMWLHERWKPYGFKMYF